jgi:hypothetical protein
MTKLTLEDFIKHIPKAHEAQTFLQLFQQKEDPLHSIPLPSLIALYLIHDLYDLASSDKANLMRITTSLEAAANDLLLFRKLMKNVAELPEENV